ncbi:MAG: hypothetical protein IKA41_09350 [Bacteroidaceae bacterium]|nr:hypothetical protein [Bacteroidaceae bacterium]
MPKTDQARIRTLQQAINSSVQNGIYTNVLSYNTYYKAKNFLEKFSKEVDIYKKCIIEQSSKRGNEKFESALKRARMYVSHFIQVLSMSIVREEIPRSKRPYYGLPEDEDTIPNLFSESAVLEWGAKIIEGESRRQREGGVPIYNPTMARVKVIYDLYKEMYDRQQYLRTRTAAALKNIAEMRDEGDEIIYDVWSEIENAFAEFSPEEKIRKCAEYGVIYYTRTDRKKREQ